MKNKKILQDMIPVELNKGNVSKNKIALQGMENLQKSFQVQFQTLKTLLITNKQKRDEPRYFSFDRKHQSLKLSKDRKAVSNSNEYGKLFVNLSHYYCLTEKDFDIYNPLFKFNKGKIDKDTSYWFSFVFPTLCQNRKWTNIYYQGMGGFFIVIFENGKKINFWNNEKVGFKNSQELSLKAIQSYISIELFINFETKQLIFNRNEGKKTLIKSIKPQKWFGKIYPAVRFYGNGGIITIQ